VPAEMIQTSRGLDFTEKEFFGEPVEVLAY